MGCSIPIFPVNDLDVQPGQKVYLKVKAPYSDPLSGMAIGKFFAGDHTHTLKTNFRNNQSVIEFRNQDLNIAKLRTNSAVGVLDLRSLGYFRVTYQRLVTMTEKHFNLHHYSQMRGVDTCQEHCENQTGNYLKMYDSKSDLPGKLVERRKGKTTTTHKHRDIENPLHDPYPWLEKDDPCRFQTDAEILYEKIDLKESALTSKEKTKLMKMILRYRDAFSLRDEIGGCPNLKADIKVIDESPFFVRPFSISEADKPFMDNQMERLVALGILSKNSTSHTSPVMLITCKLTNDKRPVVDFRLLKTRILCRNTSIPLMSDVLSILGNSDCELLSCVDIKDAFHSIPLTDKSKEFCGILPYFGSPIYRYEVLPMGITCACQIWMDYITLILGELEQKNKYIAIMDDLLIHSSRKDHWNYWNNYLLPCIRMDFGLAPKSVSCFEPDLHIWEMILSLTKSP